MRSEEAPVLPSVLEALRGEKVFSVDSEKFHLFLVRYRDRLYVEIFTKGEGDQFTMIFELPRPFDVERGDYHVTARRGEKFFHVYNWNGELVIHIEGAKVIWRPREFSWETRERREPPWSR